MNKAIIIGNLTKDPELRTTPNGVSVCTFTIAVQRTFSREAEKKADFIPVVTWRGLADNCGKYLAKGRPVAVSGSIQTRSYTNSNGEKRYATEIVAEDVQFLGKAPGNTDRNDTEADSAGIFNDNVSDFTPIDDEELPF